MTRRFLVRVFSDHAAAHAAEAALRRAAAPLFVYWFPGANPPDPQGRLGAFILNVAFAFIGRPMATLAPMLVPSGRVAMMLEVDDASFDAAQAAMDSHLARTAR